MSPDRPARVRRPRYLAFLVTGGLIGLLVTVVVAASADEAVGSTRRLMLYLGILLGGLGTLAGGAFAVWLERDARDG